MEYCLWNDTTPNNKAAGPSEDWKPARVPTVLSPFGSRGDKGTYPTAPAWLSAKRTCTPDRQWRDGALERGLPEGISAHLPGSPLRQEKCPRTTGTLRTKGNWPEDRPGFAAASLLPLIQENYTPHNSFPQGPCHLRRDTLHAGPWTGSPACCGERVEAGAWRRSPNCEDGEPAGRQEAQVLEGTSDPWWRAS